MTGVFTREEQAQRQIHKTPREDRGRDHNTTTIDEGTPKFYSHHQKVRGGGGGGGKDVSLDECLLFHLMDLNWICSQLNLAENLLLTLTVMKP